MHLYFTASKLACGLRTSSEPRAWSTKACEVRVTEATHVSCRCRGLGTFALFTIARSTLVSFIQQKYPRKATAGPIQTKTFTYFFSIIYTLLQNCNQRDYQFNRQYPPPLGQGDQKTTKKTSVNHPD